MAWQEWCLVMSLSTTCRCMGVPLIHWNGRQCVQDFCVCPSHALVDDLVGHFVEYIPRRGDCGV